MAFRPYLAFAGNCREAQRLAKVALCRSVVVAIPGQHAQRPFRRAPCRWIAGFPCCPEGGMGETAALHRVVGDEAQGLLGEFLGRGCRAMGLLQGVRPNLVPFRAHARVLRLTP